MFAKYLASFGILTDDEISQALAHVKIKSLRKSDYFIQEGQTCKEVCFVRSGTFRTFFCSSKSEEISYCITFPGQLLTAYSSFIAAAKSSENIQALQPATIEILSKSLIDNTAATSPNWMKLLKVMAEGQYIALEDRIFQLQKYDAVQRYKNLLKKHPEYIQQIPLQYLASYLGITQRHLSRIRKEIF